MNKSYLRLVFYAFILFIGNVAYADSGELIWEDRFDYSSLEDRARVIAASRNVVFAAGSVTEPVCFEASIPDECAISDFIVRAYNARTGELVWWDQLDGTFSARPGFEELEADEARAIAVMGDRVFVVGTIHNEETGVDFLVRAYNAKTGRLLWQDQASGTRSGRFLLDKANAVVAVGHRVFVAGTLLNENTLDDFVIRAYDARTGKLLWQDQYDGTNGRDRAMAIAAKGKRIFVGGMVELPGFDNNFTVRSYDAQSGNLLWQDQVSGTALISTDHVNAIVVKGDKVFAGGLITNDGSQGDFAVRTYNNRTGKLLWQDQLDGSANSFDELRDLAVNGKNLFAAGEERDVNTGFNFFVRAYQIQSGRVVWEDRVSGQTVPFGGDRAFAVSAGANRVVAAGVLQDQDTGDDFVVRAYGSRSGDLAWHDQVNGLDGTFDQANDVEVKHNRAYVAGIVGGDFAVRVYRLKNR